MNRKNSPQKNPKSNSSRPHPIVFIAAGICIFGGIYYFGFRHTGPSPSKLSAEAPPTKIKSEQIQVLSTKEATVDLIKYQAELNQSRAQFAQANILGLKSLEFKEKGNTVSIPIEFQPRKLWCQGGDLDTMKYAAKNDSDKDFIISLESSERSNKNPFVRVNLKKLYAGMSYNFSIERPKGTTSFGLYICSDSKQDNKCQGKTVESHEIINQKLAQDGAQAKKVDRIFFFQNLVLDSKKIESYRTDVFDAEFQKSITNHFVKKQGMNGNDLLAAWKLNTTLKSSPTDVQGGKIIISLPYNDPRCLEQAGLGKK